MPTQTVTSLVLIGAGRVGSRLGPALFRKGIRILQVADKDHRAARKVASLIGAEAISSTVSLSDRADGYLFTVPDDAVAGIAATLRLPGKLVIHTSGSVRLEELLPVSDQAGVLYPLQTFTPGNRIDFRKIPVCVEASTPEALERTLFLARLLSPEVHFLDSDQRSLLHLAAVMAANFSNYLYAVAEDLLQEENIPFRILEPLIRTTAGNAGKANLLDRQTGPAARGDTGITKRHLRMLEQHPRYREIYRIMTESITQSLRDHGKL